MPTDRTNQASESIDTSQMYWVSGKTLRELYDQLKAQYPKTGDATKLELIYNSDGTTFVIKIPTIPDPPTSGTFALGSVDGVIQWIDTTDCSTT